MSAMNTGTTIRTAKATPNVYTVLALVATIALGVTVGYLWYHNGQLTEGVSNAGGNPFYVIKDGEISG